MFHLFYYIYASHKIYTARSLIRWGICCGNKICPNLPQRNYMNKLTVECLFWIYVECSKFGANALNLLKPEISIDITGRSSSFTKIDVDQDNSQGKWTYTGLVCERYMTQCWVYFPNIRHGLLDLSWTTRFGS